MRDIYTKIVVSLKVCKNKNMDKYAYFYEVL